MDQIREILEGLKFNISKQICLPFARFVHLSKIISLLPALDKIKGIHPGAILKRELKSQNLKSTDIAMAIGEHKQTISAILNKRRNINPKLSIKLSKQFNVEADYFMLLQSSYDVKMAANDELQKTPNLSLLRPILFWDTAITKIDWDKSKNAVIKRVLERGNTAEIEEIISFYGKLTIKNQIKLMTPSRLLSFDENVRKFKLV